MEMMDGDGEGVFGTSTHHSYSVLKNGEFHGLRGREARDQRPQGFSRQVRVGEEREGAEQKEGVLVCGRYKLRSTTPAKLALKVDLITRRYTLA